MYVVGRLGPPCTEAMHVTRILLLAMLLGSFMQLSAALNRLGLLDTTGGVTSEEVAANPWKVSGTLDRFGALRHKVPLPGSALLIR